MTNKKRTAKKVTTNRRTRPTVEEIEEVQQTLPLEESEVAVPILSPEQQAAVDMENARLTGFMNQMQQQYLLGRIGDLAAENTQLRETIDTLQKRLQKYEDEKSDES